MLNMFEVIETNNMIEHEKLDVRTITMGISLLDCCDDDLQALNEKIYKTMASSGAGSLALGIVVLVTGLVTGILMIVNGARLLRRKSEILI